MRGLPVCAIGSSPAAGHGGGGADRPSHGAAAAQCQLAHRWRGGRRPGGRARPGGCRGEHRQRLHPGVREDLPGQRWQPVAVPGPGRPRRRHRGSQRRHRRDQVGDRRAGLRRLDRLLHPGHRTEPLPDRHPRPGLRLRLRTHAVHGEETYGGTRQLVGAGAKSGIYWALDAATGQIVWSTQAGPGSTLGGIQWGSATDGVRIYIAEANSAFLPYDNNPSLPHTGSWAALDPATGAILGRPPTPAEASTPAPSPPPTAWCTPAA